MKDKIKERLEKELEGEVVVKFYDGSRYRDYEVHSIGSEDSIFGDVKRILEEELGEKRYNVGGFRYYIGKNRDEKNIQIIGFFIDNRRQKTHYPKGIIEKVKSNLHNSGIKDNEIKIGNSVVGNKIFLNVYSEIKLMRGIILMENYSWDGFDCNGGYKLVDVRFFSKFISFVFERCEE